MNYFHKKSIKENEHKIHILKFSETNKPSPSVREIYLQVTVTHDISFSFPASVAFGCKTTAEIGKPEMARPCLQYETSGVSVALLSSSQRRLLWGCFSMQIQSSHLTLCLVSLTHSSTSKDLSSRGRDTRLG